MKKIVSLLALAGILFAGSAHAVDLTFGGPPFVSKWGSAMKNGSALLASPYPGGVACIDGFIGTAAANITTGTALVLAGTTFAFSVSPTTTLADGNIIGIALESVAYGTPVQVCSGGLARANIAQTITVGDKLVSSGTAGNLTEAAAATFSPLTVTAIIAEAMESKTYVTYSAQVMVKIIGH